MAVMFQIQLSLYLINIVQINKKQLSSKTIFKADRFNIQLKINKLLPLFLKTLIKI